MKTIKIVKQFSNLREAIQNSNQAFGLEYYAKSEFNMKASNHARAMVDWYYLTEAGEIIYLTRVPGEKGIIVHEFSWVGCINDGAAAICLLLTDYNTGFAKELRVAKYKYNRNDLRKMNTLWTVDYFSTKVKVG